MIGIEAFAAFDSTAPTGDKRLSGKRSLNIYVTLARLGHCRSPPDGRELNDQTTGNEAFRDRRTRGLGLLGAERLNQARGTNACLEARKGERWSRPHHAER